MDNKIEQETKGDDLLYSHTVPSKGWSAYNEQGK